MPRPQISVVAGTHEIPSNPLEDPAIDSNLLGARCAERSTRDLRLRGCIHEVSEWKWVPCPSAGEIRWNEHSSSLDLQSSCAIIHLSLLRFDKCQDGWRCNHIEEYIMFLRWLDRVFQVKVLIPTLPMSIMVHDDRFVNPDVRWWSMTLSRTDNRYVCRCILLIGSYLSPFLILWKPWCYYQP